MSIYLAYLVSLELLGLPALLEKSKAHSRPSLINRSITVVVATITS